MPPLALNPLETLGPLRAARGASERDLTAALTDVRAALDAGQARRSMLAGAHRDLAAGRALHREMDGRLLLELERADPIAPDPAPGQAPSSLVAVRSSPIVHLDPLAPEWARTMRPHASRGPFVNDLGERFWIDTFLLPRLVSIVVHTGVLGRPRLLAKVTVRGDAGPRVALGAGSLWLSARELVGTRPAGEFVGFRISGGTMELDGLVSATADTLTLSGAWSFRLKVAPDAPRHPARAEGPGADATEARVTLPDDVTIALGATHPAQVTCGRLRARAYGSDVQLRRTDDAPFYDAASRSVVVPAEPSTRNFAFAEVRSGALAIGGTSPVGRCGWALGVTATSAAALGEATGAGAAWLELEGPLRASWAGVPAPALVPNAVLTAAPGALVLWLTVNPDEVTQTIALWEETGAEPPAHSTLSVTSASGSLVLHVSLPGVDGLLFQGTLGAHLDRPLVADGLRLPVRMPAGWLAIADTAAGRMVSAVATDPEAAQAPHIAFALQNALLKVRPPAWLGMLGQLEDGQAVSGRLFLNYPHRATVPTLPDPYAASFDFDRTQDVDVGFATSTVEWPAPDRPALAFTAQPAQGGEGGGPVDATLVRTGPQLFDGLNRTLLDVSSNADQFGVAWPAARSVTSVSGLSLVAPARTVAVVTLPPISWEPMLTKAPRPGDGDIPLVPPPHDGGAAMLVADTVTLVPVEPLPLLAAFHDAINQRRHFAARLPLPFGLVAQIQSWRDPQAGATAPFLDTGGSVYLNRPAFTHVEGGRQLAIRGRPGTAPDNRDPTIPGYVELRNENDYAQSVLSTNIHTRFDGDFGITNPNGIPLRHYEWSGYGASLLSNWRDPEAVGPAIIQARFDVLVGRTAHEVIQMQTVMHPLHVRMVRTITIERTTGGWVLRTDSGWVATGDGRMAYLGDPKGFPTAVLPAFPEPRVHRGALERVTNIRNVTLDGPQFVVPARPGTGEPPTIWQAVRFDADIEFADEDDPRLVVGGGSEGRRTPGRGHVGWLHIDGPAYQTKASDGTVVTRVRPASAAQVFDLLQVTGPGSGPLACGLALGGTAAEPGLSLRATRLTVGCTDDPNAPHLVAAAHGTPALPRDGAWTLARVGAGEPAPRALDQGGAVPVVRPNAATAGSNRWHLADARDILQLADAGTPATRYGLVQALGAQKVFFARPRVGNDPNPVTLPKPPQLADVGALLNATSVFPGLADAFDFGSLKSLSVAGGDFGFSDTFTIGSVGAIKEALLADLGAIQVVIEYRDENEFDPGNPQTRPPQPTVAAVTVNPAAATRWAVSLERVGFGVRYNNEPLIRLFATVRADEHSAPTIANLNVRYEGIVAALQTIFTNVQQVARFLPGGKDAGISVGFSSGHLTVRNAFALPKLPLGAGQITDVAVNMGFEVSLAPFDVAFVAGLGSREKPFRWIVSPLAGTGVVQVGVNPKGLDVLVQAGLGLGLAIDLGIAAGAASVTLAFELNTGPDPFEMRVILSGRASVDVLAGLASATLTLAAGLGIIPPKALLKPPYLPPSIPPPSPIGPFTVGITGSVSVGIHISVCWVIDVDWDGYWQFRQDIETPAIPIPL